MNIGKLKNRLVNERFWFLRRPIQIAGDLAILSVAFFFSYLPTINIRLADFYEEIALLQVPLVVLVQFAVLFLFGAYNIIWRYIGLNDLKIFLASAFVSALILLSIRFFFSGFVPDDWKIPVSVILIDTALGFGGILGVRIFRRLIYEMTDTPESFPKGARRFRHKTLVVGAGRLGSMAVREILINRDSGIEVKGFVDDDRAKLGGSVGGIKVLGTTEKLPKLSAELEIDQVIIAIDEAKGTDIRRIVDLCRMIGVKTRILPSLSQIADGKVQVSRVRDVGIDDLLGRDEVVLDQDSLSNFLSDKTIAVTGAGGSIGSELVRQCLAYSPKKILLIERAEYLLFEVGREIAQEVTDSEIVPVLGDVGDRVRMNEIFEEFRPDIVFHAAAHKHVPLMESNPSEAVKNNILASRNLGEVAGEHGVKSFVLISTDKAVNPTSVMGASKRLAEIVLQDLNESFQTNYIAVRFGNVLGSAGSVIPIFKDQIRKGGPVTVTHPNMTRYFMTMPEAARLVIHAGAMGERGEIFILDMGEPVRIVELAEDLIKLSGFEPYKEIDIVFSGIRPGEKLYEELEVLGEHLVKTRHPKIYIGKISPYDRNRVSEMLADLRKSISTSSSHNIINTLGSLIPEAKLTGININTDRLGASRAHLDGPDGTDSDIKQEGG